MSERIREIQTEQHDWLDRNFPDSDDVHQFLGVVEEVGELSHSILKKSQGIRGDAMYHEEKIVDAIGDIFIFLLGYCNKKGYDIMDIIEKTWSEVKKRDWTKKEE